MKNLEKLTSIIESILFVSGNAVAISDIAEKLEVEGKDVLSSAKELQKKYGEGSGLQLLIFNKKLQFCSNPENAEAVKSVLNPIREKELSRSMLETAAIIAYKQPITRIDVEQIRGNSEYAVSKLVEMKVIEPVGRKDAVGKPILYGTTDEFLKRFQISSLDELPDYDTLLEQIAALSSAGSKTDYLYEKDEYTEEDSETKPEDKKKDKADIPSLDEEEIPDFLQGEDVERI